MNFSRVICNIIIVVSSIMMIKSVDLMNTVILDKNMMATIIGLVLLVIPSMITLASDYLEGDHWIELITSVLTVPLVLMATFVVLLPKG